MAGGAESMVAALCEDPWPPACGEPAYASRVSKRRARHVLRHFSDRVCFAHGDAHGRVVSRVYMSARPNAPCVHIVFSGYDIAAWPAFRRFDPARIIPRTVRSREAARQIAQLFDATCK